GYLKLSQCIRSVVKKKAKSLQSGMAVSEGCCEKGYLQLSQCIRSVVKKKPKLTAPGIPGGLHPSTNQALPCLASEIRRDRARSEWYGRKRGLL
ncbi:hypothetical protein M9458_057662, partial [Cirrhinus mrigala]